MQKRPFHRITQHRKLGGVCAGIAYAFGWQTNVVRILTILAMFFSVSFIFWSYLIIWAVTDEWGVDPVDFDAITGDKITH